MRELPSQFNKLLCITVILLFWQSSLLSAASVPNWVITARIANAEPDVESDEAELDAIIAQRKSENVSVLELDPGFSEYHNNAQFTARVNLIKRFTDKAHANGMKTVTYIPALEVNTIKGEVLASSMFKDHPTWVQRGFKGEPAVFYGSQEDWVEPQMESAWMSPDSPYRDYFIKRIKQMAGSGIDGIWLDVPIYYGITNDSWGGNEAGAITAFKTWASANGFASVTAPTKVDWNDTSFKAWIKWRHVNLAQFIDDVRKAAQSVNPNIVIIDEVFPVDNMDATSTALDEGWRISQHNHITVWEADSVSNVQGMKWSNQEDFINKITMYKWMRGIDRNNPSWAFSYGNEVLDASLVMSAAVSAGVSPFESKTPGMTKTVNSNFRKKWFGFIKDNETALFKQQRLANVGIWYSSASRDYQDFKIGGGFGMFNTITPPNNDPDWWGQEIGDTPLGKPHLSGYRGLAYALSRLHIPYKIVAAPGQPNNELQGLQFLLLPSVAAISNRDANTIKNFVQQGGVVLATGTEPGILDENGTLRPESILKDLFNLSTGASPQPRANAKYGQGIAIYRPDILGKEFFVSEAGTQLSNENLSDLEQLLRIHSDDFVIVKSPQQGVHIEVARPSNAKHYLYVTNFSGLKQPIVSNPQNITFQYHVPKGYKVTSAQITSPDNIATIGSVSVNKVAKDWYEFSAKVDQFSLVQLSLAQASQSTAPQSKALKWASPERQEAAESGLSFVLNKMRHGNKAVPYKYGIYTNLLNNGGLTEIYAHGHHVSAEHMGLSLRVAACMGNSSAWNQSYQYIRDAMQDPLYSIINWAIDRDRDAPLVSYDDTWLHANAPLDDFRVIRGLLDGAKAFSQTKAETLAQKLLTGIYNTTVTDRFQRTNLNFPTYPNGLVAYAWDWSGTSDTDLSPAAVATSIGKLSIDPIPVDYNDLYTMGEAGKRDPRWKDTLNSALNLLLASEVPAVKGLFYNGLEKSGTWTGDFENRDINQGKHLKAIQVLWIALHLANASEFSNDLIPATKRQRAKLAAQRSLNFFKNYYQTKGRIDEYLTFSGQPVAECVSTNNPIGCLIDRDENLIDGEARIYAQVARLALLLDDKTFASRVISEKIMTDRISDKNNPRYGQIGVSTASDNDAEAWNVLESTLTLCLEAKAGAGGNTGGGNQNKAPTAFNQSLTTKKGKSFSVQLSANDPESEPLTYRVIEAPKHGILAATAPNFVYVPNNDYIGTDTLTFKANDGELESNIATISINITGEPTGGGVISNPISDINIDANLSDWSTAIAFAIDPQDINANQAKLDWKQALLSHNKDNLYLAYKNYGNIDPSRAGIWETYLDTDRNAQTGYQLNDKLAAEYVLQGSGLYQYTGTGKDWSWTFIRSVRYQTQANIAEVKIPLSAIAKPSHIHIAFFGNNMTYTGNSEVIDYYPKASQGYFEYKIDNSTLPPETIMSNPITSLISTDGNLSDWSNIPAYPTDPAASTITPSQYRVDWNYAKLAHSADNLYFAYENLTDIDSSQWWLWSMYVDSDQNTITGYQFSDAVGADYLIQANHLYRYAGTGKNWSWTFVKSLSHGRLGKIAELAIPRIDIGNPTQINFILHGSNINYAQDFQPSFDRYSGNEGYFQYELQ